MIYDSGLPSWDEIFEGFDFEAAQKQGADEIVIDAAADDDEEFDFEAYGFVAE